MPNSIVSKSSITNNLSVSVTDQLPDIEVGDHNDTALHLGAAGLIPLAEVRKCNIDMRLAVFNAKAARAVLIANRAAIEASGVRFDWTHLDTMNTLGRAVTFMVRQVVPRESSEVNALLRDGRPLRRLLLSNARTQIIAGRCPADALANIARQRGPLAAADDLVNLAFVHTQHGLVDGVTVSQEQITRAKAIGTELRDKIRPTGETRAAPLTFAQRDAITLRDRLWTLFLQRYQQMERAGGAIWGADLRKHLPSIHARFVAKKSKKPDAPAG